MEMSTFDMRELAYGNPRPVSPRYTDGGFVEGTSITYGGQLYKVAGYSNNGWPPHWNAIVKGVE